MITVSGPAVLVTRRSFTQADNIFQRREPAGKFGLSPYLAGRRGNTAVNKSDDIRRNQILCAEQRRLLGANEKA